MARSSQRPDGAVLVRTYQELDGFVQAFAQAKLNLLWIVGRPGVQKSRVVQAAAGGRACWIDGNATAFGLYCALYRQRNRWVVIDDVDGLYADRAALRLLKCLCQTELRKRIGWHSGAAALRREGIPTSFQTTARLVIIANDLQTRNVNVAAVQDRGHVVWFDPSALEVHRRTALWFWDQEVFDFIGWHLHLPEALSMRDYRLAWELKRADLDWRDWLLQRWGLTGKRLLVARLKADPSFRTDQQRVHTFVQLGGGCRATYYNHARKLGSAVKPPKIRLTCRPPRENVLDPHLLDLLRQRFGELGRG